MIALIWFVLAALAANRRGGPTPIGEL